MRRIEDIASCHPAGIILREKDMLEEEYKLLAIQVMEICRSYNTTCILHYFTEQALALGAKAIHLPLPVLRGLTAEQKAVFDCIGVSCHSAEDAKEVQRLGGTYITAGHIFETDCKKGIPGRGIDFLKNIVTSVQIPVYAIGGIDRQNIHLVRSTGVAGVCVMSGIMRCENVRQYFKQIEGEI